ncbi:hypothetical protein HF289_01620 [Acidithiobacillus ferrooxidans]|uniref:hypothetical protein n=1 Tax=Acidithiobacillus ferrooxidans TaxID=920 RepID=UPI001C06D43F|nr:hypothetical protein [Acidithiobacillus ferrooxidans]MBU2855617.1 hypothetical protein [Acidithiobacillus ferrooxidans]
MGILTDFTAGAHGVSNRSAIPGSRTASFSANLGTALRGMPSDFRPGSGLEGI